MRKGSVSREKDQKKLKFSLFLLWRSIFSYIFFRIVDFVIQYGCVKKITHWLRPTHILAWDEGPLNSNREDPLNANGRFLELLEARQYERWAQGVCNPIAYHIFWAAPFNHLDKVRYRRGRRPSRKIFSFWAFFQFLVHFHSTWSPLLFFTRSKKLRVLIIIKRAAFGRAQ